MRWVAGAEGGGEVPVVTMGSSVAGAAVAGAGATEIRCGLLVGADGTARTLATAMESRDAAPRDFNLWSRTANGLVDSLPFGLGSQLGPPRVRVVRYEDDNRCVYKTLTPTPTLVLTRTVTLTPTPDPDPNLHPNSDPNPNPIPNPNHYPNQARV